MSAPSPLCRTLHFVLALAVSVTAWAHAAPDTSTTAHWKALHARAPERRSSRPALGKSGKEAGSRSLPRPRTAARSTAHRPGERASRPQTRFQSPKSAAAERRADWQESSRTAGLEIRRELERRHLERERAERERIERERRSREMSLDAEAPTRDERPTARRPAEPSRLADDSIERPAVNPRGLAEEASLRLTRGGMPAPLRGSLASLERQDERLQADGLEPIEDESDLAARIAHHFLVPLPVSSALTVNDELLPRHRYCRPWTALFLANLARDHDAAFHRPLEVTSAVRPASYQERLMRINGNAAPAEGDVFSPHMMGATIDIGKKAMSLEEIAWMRRRLLALEEAGVIDVEEEFEQACFHITVYKSYALRHVPLLEPGFRTRTAEPDVEGDAGGQ